MHYRDMIIQNGDPVEMDENDAEEGLMDERRRFKEVDKRIMKEHLFAKPDFGRDDLMRLLGVDKNTLPSIIQRFTGTNVPGYVNNKRMEYAVQLIKQHPEYTLGAISEACGIKSPATFIRNFKSTYGMTPSEFRKQLDDTEITPPQY
jgi:AraC-like DNA-binding protein